MGVAQWGYALVGNEGKKLKKVTAMSIENLKAIGLIVFMMVTVEQTNQRGLCHFRWICAVEIAPQAVHDLGVAWTVKIHSQIDQ